MNVSLLSLRCGHDFTFMQLDADSHTLQYAYWNARHSQKLMFARAVLAVRVAVLGHGRLSRCAGVLKRSTNATAAAVYAIGSMLLLCLSFLSMSAKPLQIQIYINAYLLSLRHGTCQDFA